MAGFFRRLLPSRPCPREHHPAAIWADTRASVLAAPSSGRAEVGEAETVVADQKCAESMELCAGEVRRLALADEGCFPRVYETLSLQRHSARKGLPRLTTTAAM